MGLKTKMDGKSPAAKKPATKPKAKASASYAKVRVETFLLGELDDAPYNARTISQAALDGLGASIQDFGLVSLPVVNVADGKKRLVGGHQRKKVLIDQYGVDAEVQCIVVEFDEVTEQRANFALNNRAIQGEFVPSMVRDLLEELRYKSDVLNEKVFGRLRFDKLLKQVMRNMKTVKGHDDVVTTGATADDESPGLGKAKAKSKVGVVYEMGDHLLQVGPPKQSGTLHAFGMDSADAAICQFVGKQISSDGYAMLMQHALNNTMGAMFACCTPENLTLIQSLLVEHGGIWSNTLLAYSPASKPQAGKTYRSIELPMLYGWRDGTPRYFSGERDVGNVWKLNEAMPKDDLPVEALVRAIQYSTKAGGIVLDMNLRKGATLIACEKTGRRCIGYAHSPREADSVRARWAAFKHGKGANWSALTKEVKA